MTTMIGHRRWLLMSLALSVVCARQINVTNNCDVIVWANAQGVPKLDDGLQELQPGQSYAYDVPDEGWFGSVWPKLGCLDSGEECAYGQVEPPCPPDGCQPPANTRANVFMPHVSSDADVLYGIYLEDGYSLGVLIAPSNEADGCRQIGCNLTFSSCPGDEQDVGDLNVVVDDAHVACLSPCSKWKAPAPFGLDRSEQEEPGAHYCCAQPVTQEDCQSGPLVASQYYNLLHTECPDASSYIYDHGQTVQTCPLDTSLDITFCP